MTAYYYYNLIDENYYVQNEDGIVVGIGTTLNEAVEEAEFWGLNCTDLQKKED